MKITPDTLAKHLAWIQGKDGGERIETKWGTNLRGVNLRGVNLSGASLFGADLRGADLSGADLSGANLEQVDFRGAYLMRAKLCGANIADALLSGAFLSCADLSGADFIGADLRNVNLECTTNVPDYVSAMTSIVTEGQLIVYKTLQHGDDDVVATLRIPAEAKRSNATGRRCRAEYAEVLAIQDRDGNEVNEGIRNWDAQDVYRVGETVHPYEWCDDRWQELPGGIIFYLTRWEAENYCIWNS